MFCRANEDKTNQEPKFKKGQKNSSNLYIYITLKMEFSICLLLILHIQYNIQIFMPEGSRRIPFKVIKPVSYSMTMNFSI